MDDPLRPERRPVASTAPVEADRREEPSGWLPCYAWWPRPEDYSVTVVLTPYHATVDPEAEFRFVLRGYAGSPTPEWEREAGRVRFGEQRAVRLDDLELPDPPEHGGVLEVHTIRLDAAPPKGTKFLGMWVDAHGRRGGGTWRRRSRSRARPSCWPAMTSRWSRGSSPRASSRARWSC